MNHEVPQPMTATRSPAAGNAGACTGSSSSTRAQHSGWLVISSKVWDIVLLESVAEDGTQGGLEAVAVRADQVVAQLPDPLDRQRGGGRGIGHRGVADVPRVVFEGRTHHEVVDAQVGPVQRG